MAVKVNLIPSIKYERLKRRKMRRRIFMGALAGIAVGVVTPLILWGVSAGQKAVIERDKEETKNLINEFNQIENIDTILTVQNQLETIPSVKTEDQRMSLFFTDIIPRFLPKGVSMQLLQIEDSGSVIFTFESPSFVEMAETYQGLQSAKVNPDDENSENLFSDLFIESINTSPEAGKVEFTIFATFNNSAIIYTEPVADEQSEDEQGSDTSGEAEDGEVIDGQE